jgi:hypothetical protein
LEAATMKEGTLTVARPEITWDHLGMALESAHEAQLRVGQIAALIDVLNDATGTTDPDLEVCATAAVTLLLDQVPALKKLLGSLIEELNAATARAEGGA